MTQEGADVMTPAIYLFVIKGAVVLVDAIYKWIAAAAGKKVEDVRADIAKEMGDTKAAQDAAEARERKNIEG